MRRNAPSRPPTASLKEGSRLRRTPGPGAARDDARSHYMSHQSWLVLARDLYPERRSGDERRDGRGAVADRTPGRIDAARRFLRRPLAGRLVHCARVLGATHDPHSDGAARNRDCHRVRCRRRIMEVYAQDFAVELKDDASPLTQADLAAHRVIVEGLRRCSRRAVLSEESAHVAWEERQYWTSYWLVDPLDGTREFVKRNGEFSVNIALIHMGAPVLGVVQAPVDGRVCMPHAARTRSAAMATATRCCTRAPRRPSRYGWPPAVRTRRAYYRRAGSHGRDRRGCARVVVEVLPHRRRQPGRVSALRPTSEWDTAAGQCVLHAAGGVLLPAPAANRFAITAATPCSMATSLRWATLICPGEIGWPEPCVWRTAREVGLLARRAATAASTAVATALLRRMRTT